VPAAERVAKQLLHIVQFSIARFAVSVSALAEGVTGLRKQALGCMRLYAALAVQMEASLTAMHLHVRQAVEAMRQASDQRQRQFEQVKQQILHNIREQREWQCRRKRALLPWLPGATMVLAGAFLAGAHWNQGLQLRAATARAGIRT
jgi:hypothetical protein